MGVVRVAGRLFLMLSRRSRSWRLPESPCGRWTFRANPTAGSSEGRGVFSSSSGLHQNATQRAAAVYKTDHAVFFVHMERARRNRNPSSASCCGCATAASAAGHGISQRKHRYHVRGESRLACRPAASLIIGSGQQRGHGPRSVGCLCGKGRGREECGNKTASAQSAHKSDEICFHLGSSSGKSCRKSRSPASSILEVEGLQSGCGKYFAELSGMKRSVEKLPQSCAKGRCGMLILHNGAVYALSGITCQRAKRA